MACPSFDSAVRDGLQPAGELRHVQRHGHEPHVLCALAARVPTLQSRPPRARRLRSPLPHALPPPGPHLARHRACPPFDSAGRAQVQPAGELRHVQRHNHGRNVLRALAACTLPPSLQLGPPRARALLLVPCSACAPCSSCARRPRALPEPPHSRVLRMRAGCAAAAPDTLLRQRVQTPPFDSADCAEVQPAAELQHVQRHEHGCHVLRALAPRVPCPPALSRVLPLHATCAAATSCLPARTSPGIACPPFDSAVRGGVQPAAELPRVQRHGHELDVLRALAARALPPSPPFESSPRDLTPHRVPSFRFGSTRTPCPMPTRC